MRAIKPRHIILAAGGFLCWFALRQHLYDVSTAWWQQLFDEIVHIIAGVFGLWLVANYVMMARKDQQEAKKAKRKNRKEDDGTLQTS